MLFLTYAGLFPCRKVQLPSAYTYAHTYECSVTGGTDVGDDGASGAAKAFICTRATAATAGREIAATLIPGSAFNSRFTLDISILLDRPTLPEQAG